MEEQIKTKMEMLATIQIQSGCTKETTKFDIEILKQISYFEAYFSERWKKEKEKTSDGEGVEVEKKEEEICIIKTDQFTMEDLTILIEQIIKKSNIDPSKVHYNQLPSIITCAGFLCYPINFYIITTFMGKCVPVIPWQTFQQWMTVYNTDSHQILVKAIGEFIFKQRALSEESQREILLACLQKGTWPFQTWPFQTWFIKDKIFWKFGLRHLLFIIQDFMPTTNRNTYYFGRCYAEMILLIYGNIKTLWIE